VRSIGGLVVLLAVMMRSRICSGNSRCAARPFISFATARISRSIGWSFAVIALPLATGVRDRVSNAGVGRMLAVLLLGERFTFRRGGSIVLGFAACW